MHFGPVWARRQEQDCAQRAGPRCCCCGCWVRRAAEAARSAAARSAAARSAAASAARVGRLVAEAWTWSCLGLPFHRVTAAEEEAASAVPRRTWPKTWSPAAAWRGRGHSPAPNPGRSSPAPFPARQHPHCSRRDNRGLSTIGKGREEEKGKERKREKEIRRKRKRERKRERERERDGKTTEK